MPLFLHVYAKSVSPDEQQRQHDTLVITDEVRSRVMALTIDFPAVWCDPRTTDRDRKRLLRLLIEDVTLLKTEQAITLQIWFRGVALGR